MKKTKQAVPTGELKMLMLTHGISEDVALKLGHVAVSMAQSLFEKWRNNSVIYRKNPFEVTQK